AVELSLGRVVVVAVLGLGAIGFDDRGYAAVGVVRDLTLATQCIGLGLESAGRFVVVTPRVAEHVDYARQSAAAVRVLHAPVGQIADHAQLIARPFEEQNLG